MTPAFPAAITAAMRGGISGPAWLGGMEILESRVHRTVVSGRVVDTIRWSDGSVVHTALADRIVYEDLNHDGKLDRGDPTSTTDLAGRYKFNLAPGSYTIRLQELKGWQSAGLESATVDGTAAAGPTFSTRMIRPTRIDVLSVYTSAARASLGDYASSSSAAVRKLFVDANQVYANSNTNVVLDPVFITPSSYRESGDISSDLDHLSGATGALVSLPKLRDRVRADVQVLFTSGDRTNGSDIGLSYEFSTDSDAASFADAVVALQADGTDGTTLAHEIGHILGAGHDQPNNGGAGVTPYAYAYHFVASNGRTYQDVMDYSNGNVLPFFSTPDFSWLGHPLGDARSADNARIVREEAPIVAAYR